MHAVNHAAPPNRLSLASTPPLRNGGRSAGRQCGPLRHNVKRHYRYCCCRHTTIKGSLIFHNCQLNHLRDPELGTRPAMANSHDRQQCHSARSHRPSARRARPVRGTAGRDTQAGARVTTAIPRCLGSSPLAAVARCARPVRRILDDLRAELVRVLRRWLPDPRQRRGAREGHRRTARSAVPAAATCPCHAPSPPGDAVGRDRDLAADRDLCRRGRLAYAPPPATEPLTACPRPTTCMDPPTRQVSASLVTPAR